MSIAPAELRPGIDLHEPSIRANPFPTYTQMRNEHPVCLTEPAGLWAISRFEDVQYALKNHALFSSAGFRAMIKPDWLHVDYTNDSLLCLDPPKHSQQRVLINKAFVNRVIEKLIPLMQSSAARLVSAMAEKESPDFLDDFSYPYLSNIISKIIGTDPDSYHIVREWLDTVGLVNPIRPDDEVVEKIESVIRRQNAYLESVIKSRQQARQQDLLSELIDAEVEGQKLSDYDLLQFLNLLMAAGFDTTVHLLSNCMLELSKRPELTGQLAEDRGLIPAFIEEMLRFNPPTHSLLRLTTEEVTLSGICIPKGAYVLVMLGAANRDPEKFPDPDVLDIHRNNRGQLAFGHGIHTCVGAALARLEVKIALEALFERFSAVQTPAEESLPWSHSLSSRGPTALPVTFTRK